MDNTLAQIINDLIAANQEIARLRQEQEFLRANQKPVEADAGPSAGRGLEPMKATEPNDG